MPSRKNINLEKVPASLSPVCPQCKAQIEPAQIRRIGFDEIKCPWCDAIFQARKSEGITCPHCHDETGIETAAALDQTFMSRKACEKCDREFLIVDGVPMTEDQYSRKSEA
jgi:transposase-like protein